MAYPGDQQQTGGWAPPQPPQSPYGPAEDQAAHGGYPYDPAYGSAPSHSVEPRTSYGGGPVPYDQAPAYGAEQPGSYGEGPGPYGEGPGGYGEGPGAYQYGDDEPHSGRSRKPLIIGAAVAVGVVVIGGGTALALSGGGGDKQPTASAPTTQAAKPSPTATPTPTPTETGRGDRLNSRATDPRPLTLNEVFKAKTFKGGGRTYAMTVRRSDRKCANGVHGIVFSKALVKAGCSQVLRATFSNGKFVGTIGVLNLRSEAAANAAQKASRPKDAYVLPLPGAGSTKKIGQGLSLTTAEVDGHYLILSWVQYPTGKKIAASDYGSVTAFVQNTTLGSNLRPALNYRSMEGKPA